jgi:hypothetical protein
LIDPTFSSTGGMLRQETLPLKLMAPCLDVLRELSATERDLIRLVVETVQELRDSDDNDDATADTFVSAESSTFHRILNNRTGRSRSKFRGNAAT